MNAFADRPSLRWAVPVAAVAVIGAGSLLVSQEASADAGLAPRTAAQLLVDLQTSDQHALSGTVRQKVDLGLPEIPALTGGSPAGVSGSSSAAGLTSVLSGTHTWRLWVAGPTQTRVALVDGSNETDLIRNGSDVWVWSSADTSATHDTVTARSGKPATAAPADVPKTPQEAAQKALAALDPTTSVTTSGTAVVAGRPAYELVLAPKSGGSRVAQVRIAVDEATKVPLRVEVFSTKAANPAIDVAFTHIDFGAPDASRFTFVAPPGTTVTEGSKAGAAADKTGVAQKPLSPKVVGAGWNAVAVLTLPKATASSTSSQGSEESSAQSMLAALPKVSGAWGSGHLVDGTLFSAILTDDGRVAVGAVDPEALYAALAAS